MSHYKAVATTEPLDRLARHATVSDLSPFVQPSSRQVSAYKTHFKRALDIFLISLAAIVVAPVVLIMALLVFLSDGHNPFYCQQRVGKDRQIFRMWKLRSMVVNADTVLEAYLAQNADARKEWDRHQKLRNDPRITRIGRIIRKTSLDELPQLWNVARGDMSLVGPRPIMTCQVSLYPCNAYYRLRPGLTGFWQVSSRNKSTFAERARFDRLYEMRVSFMTDVSVILRTVGVVLRGTGV